jgi:hypothetical protein
VNAVIYGIEFFTKCLYFLLKGERERKEKGEEYNMNK